MRSFRRILVKYEHLDSENGPWKFAKEFRSKHVTSKTFKVYETFEKIILS